MVQRYCFFALIFRFNSLRKRLIEKFLIVDNLLKLVIVLPKTYKKTIMKTALLILSLSFLAFTSFSAVVTIDSLRVITVDNVDKLIIYSTSSSTNCDITAHSISFVDDSIEVELTFTIGFAAAMCHSVDTFDLPNISYGTHPINIHVNSSNGFFEDFTYRSSIQLVESFVGIHSISKTENLTYYPNPFTNHIVVNSESKIQQLKITDLKGKTLYHSNPMAFKTEISTIDFKHGIYIMELTLENLELVKLKLGSHYPNKFLFSWD